jgi:hypothetical protein
MDINSVGTVSEDAGTFVHFKDVEGNLLFDTDESMVGGTVPVGAVVAGTYSSVYRKAQRKVKEKNLRAARRNEDFGVDTLDDSTIDLETACILSWTFTSNGQPFPITADNWRAIAAKQPQWQEQVQAAMTDHARFFSKKSTG